MSNQQEARLISSIVQRVNQGTPNSIGILCPDEKAKSYLLLAERRKLPVVELRMKIRDSEGRLFCATEGDIPCQIGVSEFKRNAVPDVQIAAFSLKDNGDAESLFTSCNNDLTGYLHVVAKESRTDDVVYHSLSVVFERGEGAMFRNSDPSLVRYMDIVSKLVERSFDSSYE